MKDRIDEILRGSFDLHVQAGPDPGQEWRVDALDAGRYAHEAEMAGFALKSHHYPTAPLAHALNRVYPGLNVVGAVALNAHVGGINPHAVEASAAMGAGVVWMPTYDADFFMRRQGLGPGIRVLDETGRLRPEVHDVIEVARLNGMVLASGCLAPDETIALFAAANAAGVERLLATPPALTASLGDMAAMTARGAFVELTMLACMPSFRLMTLDAVVETVRALGPQRCVVTTDFGQLVNPPPAEGMRMAIAGLLDAGLSPAEVETLVKTNPRHLVGLDPTAQTSQA